MAAFFRAEEMNRFANDSGILLKEIIESKILASARAGSFSTTQAVSFANPTELARLLLKFELLGYSIDASTEPGSWRISW